MAYGLTATGFLAKTLEIQRSEMNADAQAKLGASVDVSDRSRLGKLLGIVAERLTTLWELAEVIYEKWDPDAATGDALKKLASITGTIEEPASGSTVTLTLTGISGSATPPVGSRAATSSSGVEFKTLAQSPTTFTAVTAWAGTTAYVVGDRRRTNVASVDRVYQCVVSGTSSSSAPTGETGAVVDGTVTWAYLGRGTGAVDYASESVDDGPLVAVARDITVIKTPVTDWLSVINLAAAELGQLEETDEDLRTRREEEITTLGSTPVDAIRADVLKVEDVTAVTVFQNFTDVTDADGVPPHSVEVMVTGGLDQDIYDALLASVAAGIRTHGTSTGTAVDEEGFSHTIKFSRPTLVPIYVDVVLKKDSTYPSDGDTQVKNKIVELGNKQKTGKNVVSTGVANWVYEVVGVHDVDPPEIGLAPSPTLTTTVAISSRQQAEFAVARITVTSSTGTP